MLFSLRDVARTLRFYIVKFAPHGSPALTGGRKAEELLQALKTADCLNEASFLPFSLKEFRSSPAGTAGALSFWYLFLSGKRKKKYKETLQSYAISPDAQRAGNGKNRRGAKPRKTPLPRARALQEG